MSNLRTDYLDCLLIHRPDPLMEADEMAEAFAATGITLSRAQWFAIWSAASGCEVP